MKIKIVNTICYIDPESQKNKKLIYGLSDRLSAIAAGHSTDPRFQAGTWDGRVRFVRHYSGHLGFPVGLLPDALHWLRERGVQGEIEDTRPEPRQVLDNIQFIGAEIGKAPRDYQLEAVESVLRDRGPFTAAGLIVIPVRGGKTTISAMLFARLRCRALFVVPSKGLCAQAVRVFRELLSGVTIGQCGDGVWQPGDITVATIQSLTRNPLRGMAIAREADVMVIDEGHHLATGGKWRNFVLKSPCRYKIGLTGTPPEFGSEQGESEEMLWLRACTGPVLYRMSMKRLMDLGFLKSPTILMYPIHTIEKRRVTAPLPGARWQETYRCGIVDNYARNRAIGELVAHVTELGLRTLIDVGRIEHIKTIRAVLDEIGIPYSVCWSDTKIANRLAAERAQRELTKPVILGTVYGEGIDLPELEVVVAAEGMKATRTTIQRLRNLTVIEGKGEVLVIDFLDYRSPTLLEHSLTREKTYLSRRGFYVRRVEHRLGEPYRIPDDIVERLTSHRKQNEARNQSN
jgi:superfamily II DNA or RNA helicase